MWNENDEKQLQQLINKKRHYKENLSSIDALIDTLVNYKDSELLEVPSYSINFTGARNTQLDLNIVIFNSAVDHFFRCKKYYDKP